MFSRRDRTRAVSIARIEVCAARRHRLTPPFNSQHCVETLFSTRQFGFRPELAFSVSYDAVPGRLSCKRLRLHHRQAPPAIQARCAQHAMLCRVRRVNRRVSRASVSALKLPDTAPSDKQSSNVCRFHHRIDSQQQLELNHIERLNFSAQNLISTSSKHLS